MGQKESDIIASSRDTMEWFRTQDSHVLDWPIQSIDIQSIENLS